MSLLRTHVGLMFVYAAMVALFFSLLWKHDRSERIRSFLLIFCSLFLGGIALGWLMFPLPVK